MWRRVKSGGNGSEKCTKSNKLIEELKLNKENNVICLCSIFFPLNTADRFYLFSFCNNLYLFHFCMQVSSTSFSLHYWNCCFGWKFFILFTCFMRHFSSFWKLPLQIEMLQNCSQLPLHTASVCTSYLNIRAPAWHIATWVSFHYPVKKICTVIAYRPTVGTVLLFLSIKIVVGFY